ncbi:hypothetical protein BCR34DRAFT_572705 [Clohesyomyces aquaticus]|uniref:Uncharacterized protein n=1 Tax=Clohesyomyces aquaticus TaxID=1231657 RepID=A0A1Y1Z2F6_9PLEO|nr:hypothetical protein BCR34DRAFT_572705 [Clohesyomyces aquaticus]
MSRENQLISPVSNSSWTQTRAKPCLVSLPSRLEGYPINYCLGTPNGAAVGFFLVQHKQQLGNLIVKKAYVFFTDSMTL